MDTKLAEVGIWLMEKAKFRRPIGIDIAFVDPNLYRVELADLLPGDEQVLTGEFGDAGCDMLKLALSVWAEKPMLVGLSLPETVIGLQTLTGIDPRALSELVLGDCEAIEYVLGPLGGENGARDALKLWRGTERMVMPSYYDAIAKPIQRMRAQGVAEGQGWEVTYSELFLRVIAFYSHDPQLLKALLEDEYPPQAYLTKQLATIYDDVTEEHGFACILLTALGGDYGYLAEAYPEYAVLVAGLGDIEKLQHHLDKMIPSIHLMATGLSQVPPTGYFETMYGRRMAYRVSTRMPMPGQYLDHILTGAVQDIKNVLCVTLANQGASVDVPIIDALDHTISIKGTTKERDMLYWVGQLRGLSTLAGPLGSIPLGATVGRYNAS
jgi:hypothetical protein